MPSSDSYVLANTENNDIKLKTTKLPTMFLMSVVVLATVIITYWDLSQYFQLPEEPGILNFSYLIDPLLSGTFQNLQVPADPSSLAAIPWSILSLFLGLFSIPSGVTYLILQCVLRILLVISLVVFFKSLVTASRILSICGAFIFLSSLTGYYTSIYTTRISSVIIFSLVISTFTFTPNDPKSNQKYVFTKLLIVSLMFPGLLTNLGHFLATTSILVLTLFVYRDRLRFPLKSISRKKTILLIIVSLFLLFITIKTYFVESISSSFSQYRGFVLTFSSGKLTEIVQGRGAWWEADYLKWGGGLEKLAVQISRLLIFVLPLIYTATQTASYFKRGLRPNGLPVFLFPRLILVLALIGAYKIDRSVFSSGVEDFLMTHSMKLISANKFEVFLLFLLCISFGIVFVFGSLIKRPFLQNRLDDDLNINRLLFMSTFLIFVVWATPTDKMVLLNPFLGMFRETWTKFGGFMYIFVVAACLASAGALQQRMHRFGHLIKPFGLTISLILVLLPLVGKSSDRVRSNERILDVNSIAIVDQIGRSASEANNKISAASYLGFCLIPRYSKSSPSAVGIVRVLGPLLKNRPVLIQLTGDYGLELLQMGKRSNNCATDPNYLGVCIYDRIKIYTVQIPTWCDVTFPKKQEEL